jgi:hypothetical protein
MHPMHHGDDCVPGFRGIRELTQREYLLTHELRSSIGSIVDKILALDVLQGYISRRRALLG